MPERETVHDGSIEVTDETVVDAQTGEPIDLEAEREKRRQGDDDGAS